MRCIALAQSLKDAGEEVTFAVAESPETTLEKIENEFSAVKIKSKPGSGKDADETIEKALAVNSKWIVTDGYHFDSKYQESIKCAGLKLLFFDERSERGHLLSVTDDDANHLRMLLCDNGHGINEIGLAFIRMQFCIVDDGDLFLEFSHIHADQFRHELLGAIDGHEDRRFES